MLVGQGPILDLDSPPHATIPDVKGPLSMQGNSSSTPQKTPSSDPTQFSTQATPPQPLTTKDSKVISPLRPITVAETKETKRDRKSVRYEDLTTQDQLLLIQELENTIVYFIEMGLPLYLEGLGILFPRIEQSRRVKNLKDKFVLYTEESRTIGFEKCYELVALHRERFEGVLETRDISHRVFERGMPFLSQPYTETEVRRFVRGIIDKLRKEVVQAGRSYVLQTIGDFFALHNRQGENFSDWYAGADIFLKTRYQKTIKTEPSKFLTRPVFHDAKEPFMALLGDQIFEYTVDLAAELKSLGYEINDSEKASLTPQSFTVTVFSSPDPDKSGSQLLTYVTDGLRSIGINKGTDDARGGEFVVQTIIEPQTSMGLKSVVTIDVETLPRWPVKIITAGWILLRSSKTGRVKPGAGLAIGAEALFEGNDSALSTVFATKFLKIAGEQLSPEGAFEYISLIAISDDEAEVASLHTPHLLLTLLEYKKLNQVTKPSRSSLVAKTGLLASH